MAEGSDEIIDLSLAMGHLHHGIIREAHGTNRDP